MENRFRLHFYIQYVSGLNGGCLYNLHTGQMFLLSEKNAELLKKIENNEMIDSKDPFLKELYDKNMGDFYESEIYIEKARVGTPKEFDEIIIPRTVVNEVFLQLTNDCHGGCEFCNTDDNVYTKTRCKKWNNIDANIDLSCYIRVLNDLKYLRCNTISFIGGEPFNQLDKMKKIIEEATKLGYQYFTVYSNLEKIDNEILDLCNKYNIIIKAQIISLKDNNTYTTISGSKVINNLRMLINNRVTLIANILITKFNENEINEINEILSKLGIKAITHGFYYYNSNNEFYSKKYLNEMYLKTFPKVTKFSVGFYEKYNSCLYGKVSINLSGNVTPCPMINSYVLGNIQESAIWDILNGSEYQKFTKLNRSNIEPCSKCAYRINCTDCRAIEMYSSKNINGQEFCIHSKRMVSNE